VNLASSTQTEDQFHAGQADFSPLPEAIQGIVRCHWWFDLGVRGLPTPSPCFSQGANEGNFSKKVFRS